MFRIEIFYIILGFFIGFLIVYAQSNPKIIVKYPFVENLSKKHYQINETTC